MQLKSTHYDNTRFLQLFATFLYVRNLKSTTPRCQSRFFLRKQFVGGKPDRIYSLLFIYQLKNVFSFITLPETTASIYEPPFPERIRNIFV